MNAVLPLLLLAAAAALPSLAAGQAAPSASHKNGSGAVTELVPNRGEVIHFVHGLWFDGNAFVANDFYSEGGVLTQHPDERRAYRTVDLGGRYLVPPYGDAHTHNFDGTYGLAEVTAKYLRDGIIYAQVMTDGTVGAAEAIAAQGVNTPQTVDVTYAHGGLTATNGHPKEVYEALALGIYVGLKPEQKPLVLASNKRLGQAYWQIDNEAELKAQWPRILAAKPDLIKIYLLDSEHFAPVTAADPRYAKGLDPALVAPIVTLAHAAGLKVAAHIDTAADFHVAVVGGVDEMAHMPGYFLTAKDDARVYRLADADIAAFARRHGRVQATAGIDTSKDTPAADVQARRKSQIDNLTRLKAAGIVILVGSDYYAEDSRAEADYLQALGLWTNAEMLRMWAVETPQTIFPRRKIAAFKPGYEASFLVLAADPLKTWSASHAVAEVWKQGRQVVPSKAADTHP